MPKMLPDIAVWFLVEHAMLTIPIASLLIGIGVGAARKKRRRDWSEALMYGIAAFALSALGFNQVAATIEYEAPVLRDFTPEEAELVQRKVRNWLDMPRWSVEPQDRKAPEHFRFSVEVSDVSLEVHADEGYRLIFISAAVLPPREFLDLPAQQQQLLKKKVIVEFLRMGVQYDFEAGPEHSVLLARAIPYNDDMTQFDFLSEAQKLVNAVKMYTAYFREGLR